MPFNEDGTWSPEDASVSTRVTELLQKKNPLMQQAATGAKQYAGKRGLLNTSMAAEAGQKAALSVALPIASQEAGQAHAKNISAQAAKQGLLAQREGLASQEKIALGNVAAHDRQFGITALADFEKTYLAGWTEVMKNKDINAEQRTQYYEHLQAFADRDKALVETMYGIDLGDWGFAQSGSTPDTTIPPAPTPTEPVHAPTTAPTAPYDPYGSDSPYWSGGA